MLPTQVTRQVLKLGFNIRHSSSHHLTLKSPATRDACAHTSANRGVWRTDRWTVRQTGIQHLIFCFRPGGLSYFGSSLVGGFLCLYFTATASKRQINGQQNSAAPRVPCGANLLRVIIKLRKGEKGRGGAESRQFNKPHQIMTSVIGFYIKRQRERACAFKCDSDEICLSLFSSHACAEPRVCFPHLRVCMRDISRLRM